MSLTCPRFKKQGDPLMPMLFGQHRALVAECRVAGGRTWHLGRRPREHQSVKPERVLEKARRVQPETVVWRDDPDLFESKQGSELGHSSCISQLELKADEHEELLRRIPAKGRSKQHGWLRTVQQLLLQKVTTRMCGHASSRFSRLTEWDPTSSPAGHCRSLGGVGLGSALKPPTGPVGDCLA